MMLHDVIMQRLICQFRGFAQENDQIEVGYVLQNDNMSTLLNQLDFLNRSSQQSNRQTDKRTYWFTDVLILLFLCLYLL